MISSPARYSEQEHMSILQEINEVVRKHKHYPRICHVTSLLVSKLGFKLQNGRFALDYYTGALAEPTNEVPHWWNEDVDGKRIDLLGCQFNHCLEQPISPGVQITSPNQANYYRYLNGSKAQIPDSAILKEFPNFPEELARKLHLR